jgi:hypothetical protein
MGLSIDVFEFAHPPPSIDELQSHLREFCGGDSNFDSYEIVPPEGTSRGGPFRAKLYCMLGAGLGHPYACAFLISRGGVPVHHGSGEPKAMSLPAFVERPWRQWSWLQRLRFMVRS